MIIPQDFLTSIVSKYNVTTGELEALAPALAGKSIAEISIELGVQANAVRKRLGEVYQKFDIKGKGPGKLVKLQQILVAAYQEQTAKKKVILVWSGEAGKHLAQGFKQTIFKHPQIEVILCRRDLVSLSWRSEVEPLLNNTSLGICCLSNITTAINFNFGFLLGKVKQLRLLKFQQSFPEIFTSFPTIEANERSQLQDLLGELIGTQEAQTWIEYQFSQWQNSLRTTAALNTSVIGQRNWSQVTTSIEQAIKALSQNQYIHDNDCFQQIVLHSLAEINHQLETSRFSHLIPATLYPHYLMSLQKRGQIYIKALTLVDRDEDFWQQEMGREIRSSTQQESVRVFVFTTPDMFERNFEILLEHAEKYRVRVVSYQKLSQDFPEYCKSFGIIASSQSKLLAEYIFRGSVKYNRFSAETTAINQHEKILIAIIDSAVEINKPSHLPEPEEILLQMREVRDLVFERSRFAVKAVGISQYLNIENYHQCGQQRNFFQPLVKQMLAIFKQHRSGRSKLPRILEVGAKTGHFTRHLAQIKADIWALELDWLCFKKLEYNLAADAGEITIEHKDSCAYDPPYQFNYIFSCLGDRHIDIIDKEKYLKNIKRNLERGGLLIVGDEFLPPHDYQDKYARTTALETYHNYCLNLAEQQQDQKLITLETETLDCALTNQGDYKLSCEHYEHLLRKTGFTFTKEQINSSVYEKVGGVFIYKAWLNEA
ncbi:MAG: class I SAM-dependent methyltransferase [Pleurocapsa sp. MO_192.B19]|nr:class I SAM-dependent methyltransferase [Pleurocapsa sp. MO_192.B19]